MQYRPFGKLDFKVSALGLGCMRFPRLGQDPSKIDEKEAIKMIHHAIDHGINYLDTAYFYHKGQSEILLGKALKGGYREKVKVATKLPLRLVEKKGDPDRLLAEQMKKLGVDTVDFYLVHAFNRDRWKKGKELDIPGFMDRAIKDGRIRYTGFSFHDDLELFKEIVDAYPWTVCLIHVNHVDRHFQAGLAGLKYASERGLAVAIMEPMRGGSLVTRVPQDIMEIWDRAQTRRSPVEWALKWLWNQEGVSTVLSGMSTMEQIKENIELASQPLVPLTEEELKIFDDVKRRYEEKSRVNCTKCRYCMPCANNVAIPQILTKYNDLFMYEGSGDFVSYYRQLKEQEKDGSRCCECGDCMEACPQNLPITEVLREAEEYYNAGKHHR